MGLNFVRSQLLDREKLPSLEEAIGALKKDESRFRVTLESQVQHSFALLTEKLEAQAAPTGNWTPRSSQPTPILGAEEEDSRDALFYAYCKKRQHTKENY